MSGLPAAIEDSVDAVCHDDQFGDGINVSVYVPMEDRNGNSSDEGELTAVINTVSQQDMDLEDERRLMQNPRFQNLVSRAVDARIQEVIAQQPGNIGKGNDVLNVSAPQGTLNHLNSSRVIQGQMMHDKRVATEHVNMQPMIKSPSDTTIYAPALNRRAENSPCEYDRRWKSGWSRHANRF